MTNGAYLEQLIAQDRVPHLLIFSGLATMEKEIARQFALRWVGGIAVDVHQFSVQGKLGLHTIETVRQIIDVIEHTPYQAKRKAILIDEAHRMLPTSANRLLKTFEEPPSDTLIILITSELENVLPTIRSRAQILQWPSTEKEAFEQMHVLFDFLSAPRSFVEIADAAAHFAHLFEEKKKEIEKALHVQNRASFEEMYAFQKAQLSEEIAGMCALFLMQEFDRFLHALYAFYRDLWALHAGCEELLYPEWKAVLTQAYQRGRQLPLQKVEYLVRQARQRASHSVPLATVMENVFLNC